MVNLVKIYNESNSLLGEVKSKKNVEKYGVYQQTYTKQKDVNAKDEANNMLVGITKEATVEAVGQWGAIAGKSIKISDKATGLKGRFYITEDTHSIQNNTHMMTLGLSWENVMEEGATISEE